MMHEDFDYSKCDNRTDARLSVVESDTRRHESEIRELKTKQTTIEICVSCLPNMEKKINQINDEMGKKMDMMNNKLEAIDKCNTRSSIEAGAKVDFWNTKWGERMWDIIRATVIVIVTLLYAMNQHLLGVGN